MKKKFFFHKNILILVAGLLVVAGIVLLLIMSPKAEQLKMYDLGVVSFISSISLNTDKELAITKAEEAGFGWFREEYTYADPINFEPYDRAYEQILGQNRNILGLLTYPGPDVPHEKWQAYVSQVVSRYPKVSAWEIMNEVDTQLTATQYLPYLREAKDIIKSKTQALIVSSGLGESGSAYIFWDQLAENGGWDDFDALGVHLYHEGDPLKDYSQGTLEYKIRKIIANIDKNGGNKKILMTEFGYDSEKVGLTEQAQWLTTGLSIISAFDEVQRIFVYRLYEFGDGYGLISEDLKEKESFKAVANWMVGGAPMRSLEVPSKSIPSPSPSPSPTTTKIIVDKENSYVEVKKEDTSGKKEVYKVVVGLRDENGKSVITEKPQITLNGGQTELTDFKLKNDEWVGYVASSETGIRTAKISTQKVELKTVKMVFGSSTQVSVMASPTPSRRINTISVSPSIFPSIQEQINKTSEKSFAEWLGLIIAEIIVLFLIILTLRAIKNNTIT